MVIAHRQHLWNNGGFCPLDAKDVRQLFEIDRGGLADGKDGIAEPGHAELAELVIEKVDAELRGEQGNVFNDGLADAPLFVLGELHHGG
jgi:hypothetical protein